MSESALFQTAVVGIELMCSGVLYYMTNKVVLVTLVIKICTEAGIKWFHNMLQIMVIMFKVLFLFVCF